MRLKIDESMSLIPQQRVPYSKFLYHVQNKIPGMRVLSGSQKYEKYDLVSGAGQCASALMPIKQIELQCS